MGYKNTLFRVSVFILLALLISTLTIGGSILEWAETGSFFLCVFAAIAKMDPYV